MTKVISRIEEIVVEINSSLDIIQSESLKVGRLLEEAREELKNQGKQKDFIAFCKDNFGLAKAQVYKLIKVHKFFQDDERFYGVAMRALYLLATEGTKEVIDQAAKLAAKGELDTPAVQGLIDPTVDEKTPKPKVAPLTAEETSELDETLSKLEVSTDTVSQGEGDDSDVTPPPVDSKKVSEMAELLNAKNAQIEELNGTISELTDLLKQMKEQNTTHNKPAAPSLPQFDSKCAYAVLGLAEEDSRKVTKVRSAFRGLIKAGYGDGHEAFEKLTAARDVLLEAIEKAKK